MGEPWVVVIPKRLSARLRERSIFFVVFVFSPENFRSVPLSTLGFSSGLWEEAGGGSELIAATPASELEGGEGGSRGQNALSLQFGARVLLGKSPKIAVVCQIPQTHAVAPWGRRAAASTPRTEFLFYKQIRVHCRSGMLREKKPLAFSSPAERCTEKSPQLCSVNCPFSGS